MDQTNNLANVHPNGRRITSLKRNPRNDQAFHEDIFPISDVGKLLKGLVFEYLIKQEHRMGWARKSACDDTVLNLHPNETVAAHMWGVAYLIMVISSTKQFQEELPNFCVKKAYEMALIHDVAELVTGDITPVDGISEDEKHKAESLAMDVILGCFPEQVKTSLRDVYTTYENRTCAESKFVKDCDKLDFMLNAFMLERQGFTGFGEFYENSCKSGYSTKITTEMANTLVETRNKLFNENLLFKKPN